MARQEYLFLRACAHPGIVQAIDLQTEPACQLVLEYLPGTELVRPSPNSWLVLAKIAGALTAVHRAGVCINDLKPENIILLNEQPYLIDFGFATLNLARDNVLRHTPAYVAPERLAMRINHFAGDIFALGIIGVELVTGSLPATMLGECYFQTLADPTAWTEFVRSLSLPAILSRMLSHDPQLRPTAEECTAALWEVSGEGAQNGLPDAPGIRVFAGQIAAIEHLQRNGSLRYIPGDDLPCLLNLITLRAIQNGCETLIINDADCLAIGLEAYSQGIGLDLSSLSERGVPANTRIIRVHPRSARIRLFDRISTIPGVWTLIESDNSDVQPILPEELDTALIGVTESLRETLSRQTELRPLTLRALLRGDVGEADEMVGFLNAMGMPVRLDIVEWIWPDWAGRVAQGLSSGQFTLSGDRLSSTGLDSVVERKLLNQAMTIARDVHDNPLIVRIAVLLGERDTALQALEEYAAAAVKNGQLAAAHDYMEWVRDFLPDWPPALDKRFAFFLRKNGRYPEAVDQYRSVIARQTSEDKAITLGDMAIVLTETGDFPAAADGYEEALTYFRGVGKSRAVLRILNNLGALYYRMEQYPRAVQAFNEVVTRTESVQVGSVEANYRELAAHNLADVHLRTGQWSRCRLAARRAVGNPNNRKPYAVSAEMMLLFCLFAEGETTGIADAVKDLIASPELKDDPETYARVAAEGLAILRLLEPETAREIARSAETSVRFDCLHRELLVCALNSGEFRRAIEHREALHAPEEIRIAETILSGDDSMFQATMRDLLDRNDIHNVLYLLSVFASRGNISPVVRNEAGAILEVYPFMPLHRLLTNDTRQETPPQLARLWEVITAIHQETGFEQTLRAVLTALIAVNRLQRGVFFSLRLGEFEPLMALDDEFHALPLDTLRVSVSILEDTVRQGGIRFLTDLQEDISQNLRASILGLGLRQAVCCPLVADGETLGVIYADTTVDRGFSEEEKALAQAIVIQSRAAIEKNLQLQRLRERPPEELDGPLIGKSPAMQKVFATLRSVGAHNVNVIISGETGTGKEMVARALHHQYAAEAPFVAVNCAAIPETLLESELFGYSKGAFTGAAMSHTGRIAQADGGTLFLDEIGDMPLLLQAKLLRVLQDRLVTPLGETRAIPVDFRVIAATNRNLDDLVNRSMFRSDLLYRLRVLEIKLPSLRERSGDIVLLVRHFVQRYSEKFGKDVRGLSLDAIRYLQNHAFPGNVRELENMIERAVVLSDHPELGVELFDDGHKPVSREDVLPDSWADYVEEKHRRLRELDGLFARRAVDRAGGNISRASAQTGVSRVQLYRMLRDI
jgi:transcriptional regulator with GAF, ATPase, and Fis domain/tetratricopeptide (TPR) repeat protein